MSKAEDVHPQTEDELWEEICEMFSDLQGQFRSIEDPLERVDEAPNLYHRHTEGAIIRDPNTGRHYYGIVEVHTKQTIRKQKENEEY